MKAENLFTLLIISVFATGLFLYSSQSALASIILTGNGAPGSTLGNNGDIYTDISNGHYYQKNNVMWTSISSATAQALINTPPTSLQGYSSTQGYCPGMMDSQGYCTSSQGGLLTSPNYFTQSNTGSNVFCSTGIINSQGYCVNSSGGIIPPTYSASNTASSFCSTGMLSSQGYCMNSQGLVTTPAMTSSTPSYLSSQTITSSPSTLNPQVYLSNEAVTRMQPENSLQGAISSYGYMISQNATNSQAGIIPPDYSSIRNSTGANIYSCTHGVVTQQGYLCTQGILNSQGGKISSPSYSVQSNSTNSYWCATGIMNAQGLCVNSQGNVISSQNVTNSAGYLSPQVYLSNSGVIRSQPANSLQGTISGFVNSTTGASAPNYSAQNNAGSNVYSCIQGTLTSKGFLCMQGTINSQGGILGTTNSTQSSTGLNDTASNSTTSQGGILGTTNSTQSSTGLNDTASNSTTTSPGY